MKTTDPVAFSLSRRLAAEWLGTTLLLATVVGSGIMGDRLSGGIPGLALMANAVATDIIPAVATQVAMVRTQGCQRPPRLSVESDIHSATLAW